VFALGFLRIVLDNGLDCVFTLGSLAVVVDIVIVSSKSGLCL